MPSHTFTRVGAWEASVEADRRSIDVATRDSSIAEVLHASDYLAYAYLQMRGDAAALTPAPSAFPYAEATTYFARALGAAHTGRAPAARVAADSLAAIRDRLQARGEAYWGEQVAIQQLGAQAWTELAEGRRAEALRHMRAAATREDTTEKSAVTPGPLAPARELLGDMLLELGRPAEALAEYRRTLEKEPRRHHALDGARRAADLAKLTGAARR